MAEVTEGLKSGWIKGLLTRHERPLLAYALSRSRSHAEAEAVVAAAFLDLWRIGPQRAEGKEAGMLYKACRAATLARASQGQRRAPLTGLSEQDLEVLRLRLVGELSLDDMAVVLSTGQDAVRRMLREALLKAREGRRSSTGRERG